MTMDEIKKAIVESFKRIYGFAPTLKAIHPLEYGGKGNLIDFVCFHVGGIGDAYTVGGEVERAKYYDMELEQ